MLSKRQNTFFAFTFFCAMPVLVDPARSATLNTLYEQGMTDGISIASNHDAANFYVPLPADTTLSKPQLQLVLNASENLINGSGFSVFINGTPRYHESLTPKIGTPPDADRIYTIPLSPSDLAGKGISVRVIPTFVSALAECIGEAGSQGFLTIRPQTGILYADATPAQESIRSFLAMLPHSVRVQIPSRLNGNDELRNISAVATYLQQQGRVIEWITSGNDIIAGKPAQIVLKPDQKNITLVGRGADRSLEIGLAAPQALLQKPWSDLMTVSAYGSSESNINPQSHKKGEIISLESLGITADASPIASKAVWNFSLPAVVSHQQAPTFLSLNLIVPPSLPDNPLLLQVFDNNRLVGIQSLPTQGGAVSVNTHIAEATNGTSDNIRLEVVRQNSIGRCKGSLPDSYVQLLPSSKITMRPVKPAETLSQIGRTLPKTPDVYLPADALEHPKTWIASLSALATELQINPYNFRVHTGEAPTNSDVPFIWIKPEAPQGYTTPVSFEKGRVRLKKSDGSIILDAPPLPDIEFASLLKKGDARALWIKPAAASTPLTRPLGISSASGDAVLMDATGQITSIDSRVVDANDIDTPSVEYPDGKDWMDTASQSRLWFIGAALFAGVLVLLSILDRVRRPKK